MALSGTTYGPYLNSGWQRIYITWTATQDVANNTSTITAKLYWQNLAGVSLSSTIAKNVSVTIAGTTYTGTGTVGIAANTSKLLLTASKTVTHSSDGTLTTSISGIFELKYTLGGTYYGSTDASGSAALDTIPRATQLTLSASSTAMGSAVTINTPRASTAFTHTLTYAFGLATGTIATGVAISQSWTIPLTLANQVPSAVSGTGTITCHTYNGASLIGTKTVGFTATVPSAVAPTASLSISGVSLYNGYYVQSKSKAAVTVNASGSYSSTISSRATTVKSGSNTITSSSSASFTSGTLNYSGTITIATTVTDSRGRTATASTSVTVTAYSNPSITAFSAFRSNSDGSANPQGGHMRITGSASISSIGSTNTKTTILRYRVKGTSTWTNATSNTASYTPSLAATVDADVNTSYEVEIYTTDYYTSSNQQTDVGTAFVLMDFKGNGMGLAFGKVSERDMLEVATESRFESPVHFVNGSATKQVNMGSLYTGSATNVGCISIGVGSQNIMFSARITIRSYNFLATIIVGGYTYTSTTTWHLAKADGLIKGYDAVYVRFLSSGSLRFITIGDTNTDWSGYLHVTVDQVEVGYGGSFNGPFSVNLLSSYPGTSNMAVLLRDNNTYMASGGTYGTVTLNDWVRTTGGSGWYSESYGGGWHMTDTTWIRAWNNKGVYSAGGFLTGADHTSATSPRVVNTIMGTGNPPTASTVAQGTIYLKYV